MIATRRTQLKLFLFVSLAQPAVAAPPSAGSPPADRACCALGAELPIRLGRLRTPILLGNVANARHLGRHRYAGRSVFDERNGLVYTCGGGLIDLGHVRGAADWTVYAYRRIRDALGAARSIELAREGGSVRLQITTLDPGPERDTVALLIAQRAAFGLAVWHELFTAHGFGTASFYPELFSAFSPEDLYSDLLGTELGVLAVRDARPYDTAMTSLLEQRLLQLGAVDVHGTRFVLGRLAGSWWRPDRWVPADDLLRQRRFEVGPTLRPFQPNAPWICGGRNEVWLELPERGPAEHDLRKYATLEILPEPNVAAALGWDGGAPIRGADLSLLAQKLAAAETNAAPVVAETAAERAAARWQGIRLLPLSLLGGARRATEVRPTWGGEITGARAETWAGTLSLFEAFAVRGPAGSLRSGLTAVRVDGLSVCRDRNGELHLPVAAWFQACLPSRLGFGGTLLRVQHDGRSHRTAIRPVELHLAVEMLGAAFTDEILRRRLSAEIGVAIDSVTSGRPSESYELSPRARAALRGHLRSPELTWELEGFAALLQDVAERRDRGVELGLRTSHTWQVPAARNPTPAASVTLTVEAGHRVWEDPQLAIDEWIAPLLAPGRRQTWHLILRLQVTIEQLRL